MTIRKSINTALVAATLMAWFGHCLAAQIGTVLVSDLRMRTGPGKDYRIAAVLPKGATVTVMDRRNGWLEIEHKGSRGYILHRDRFIQLSDRQPKQATTRTPALKDAPQDTESIKEQMRRTQSELAAISQQEKEVLEQFNAADEALSVARKQVRAAKAGLTDVQEKIKEVHQRTSELEKEIEDGEKYAAKRLVALYKLNWVGRVHLLATSDSFFDFINRKETLERILAQDEALLEELNRNKTALGSLLEQLNTRKTEKRALELKLSQRAERLNEQQKRRKTLLRTIRSKKSLELAALKVLQQAAMELDDTIVRIEPAKPRQQLMVKRPKAKSFKAHKGLLSWPVKGKIISFFGPYRDKKFAVTNFQSGINIQAERGEPIRSVSDGHVIFSKWFKGFGNMMIVDHGDHYYTVYAHLEEVFKVKGDRVDQGEVIATVGDSGSMKGPALHFEVRHHGKPIDPLKWIQKG